MHPILSHRRRGAIAVFVAIALTVVLGMAALAVDMGMLYTAKSELQRATDAAALAAAANLITGGAVNPDTAAVQAAHEVVQRNPVMTKQMGVAVSDVELGMADVGPNGEALDFVPTTAPPYTAVRVTLRRTESSPSGAIALLFAKALGRDKANLETSAAAMLIPRDIAVVIDLSTSMDHDSQLRYWDRTDGGSANTRDIWAALDGPEPERPYLPGPEDATEYAGDEGPTFGLMTKWGSPLTPGSYNWQTDPGLYYIKPGETTTHSGLIDGLQQRNYSYAERNALCSSSGDSGGSGSHYKNRVCVLLGLAEWRSGKNGGKYSGGGDGDDRVENSELVGWASYPPFRDGWDWRDYVSWVANEGPYQGQAPEFRWRYGLKTFTDFLLEKQPGHHQTDVLWATPQQPMRATKDALQAMVDTISAEDNLDHLSLQVFAATARHEVNLTENLQSVADRLYERQAAHYDRYTNVGGGLAKAIAELDSERARPNAHKVILLMSDGNANAYMDGDWAGDYSPAARAAAINQAKIAAEKGFVIHTISVGYTVDRDLMQEIAQIGKGREFYAAGSPEEYSEELEQIFRSLGGKRPVALID